MRDAVKCEVNRLLVSILAKLPPCEVEAAFMVGKPSPDDPLFALAPGAIAVCATHKEKLLTMFPKKFGAVPIVRGRWS